MFFMNVQLTIKELLMGKNWKLLEALERRHMTQGQLAGLILMSEGWLSEVISGKRGATSGQKREIAKVLRVSKKKLFQED